MTLPSYTRRYSIISEQDLQKYYAVISDRLATQPDEFVLSLKITDFLPTVLRHLSTFTGSMPIGWSAVTIDFEYFEAFVWVNCNV